MDSALSLASTTKVSIYLSDFNTFTDAARGSGHSSAMIQSQGRFPPLWIAVDPSALDVARGYSDSSTLTLTSISGGNRGSKAR